MISLGGGVFPRLIFGKTIRRELWVTLPKKGISLLIPEHSCPDNYHVQATYKVQKFLIDNEEDSLTEEEHQEIRALFFAFWKGK